MKYRPILFSGPMVRAILEGRKTQTRRIVTPAPSADTNSVEWNTADGAFVPWQLGTSTPNSGRRTGVPIRSWYGAPGDRLWVRETWRPMGVFDAYSTPKLSAEFGESVTIRSRLTFRADGDDGISKWRPAIHLPRWASRIELKIEGIRAERLQEISYGDSVAEGAAGPMGFAELWQDIHGAHSWDRDPWVWVVTFRKVKP